jgi:hypothetical protein
MDAERPFIFVPTLQLGWGAAGHISKTGGVILQYDFLNSPTAILGGFLFPSLGGVPPEALAEGGGEGLQPAERSNT